MRTVLYPGSFDPVTAGHMDIISRAAARFERVIIGVLRNPEKTTDAFSPAERLSLLRKAAAPYPNVEAAVFEGLLARAAEACGADGVLRGLRTAGDVESEFMMARLNRQMAGVETVFLAASPAVSHISASMVRQIGRLGGDLRGLVPENLLEEISDALAQRDWNGYR
ncbi:MAG: pantetheine-phosphate adenylyltransferase [Firmicutes bacterium]|nr:pantetheine-phosphate adenylyltransferase [Bacillota bacterium]